MRIIPNSLNLEPNGSGSEKPILWLHVYILFKDPNCSVRTTKCCFRCNFLLPRLTSSPSLSHTSKMLSLLFSFLLLCPILWRINVSIMLLLLSTADKSHAMKTTMTMEYLFWLFCAVVYRTMSHRQTNRDDKWCTVMLAYSYNYSDWRDQLFTDALLSSVC